MRVLLRYVLLLLIALPLGFLWLYPQVLRCIRISQSADFQAISGPNTLYIHQAATAGQRLHLRRQVRIAQDRIQRLWGDRCGQAILIYCPTQAEYSQYCVGGEGAGCSIGMPWGASYLVLGPEGNNADVIAHELCHDELFSRLGWWRVKQQIPQWFNEGLALMVDYRFSKPGVWEQPDSVRQSSPFADEDELSPATRRPNPHRFMLKLADLETTRAFFGGDYTQVMLAYQTAADEVSRWLAIVGRAGVPDLTNAIESGSDFGEAYRQLERKKRTRK